MSILVSGFLLSILFAVLRIYNVIDWNWLLIMLPAIVVSVFVILFQLFITGIFFIIMKGKSNNMKWKIRKK